MERGVEWAAIGEKLVQHVASESVVTATNLKGCYDDEENLFG